MAFLKSIININRNGVSLLKESICKQCYNCIITRNYRQIDVKQEGKETIIEGLVFEEDNSNYLPLPDGEEDTCPIRSRGIQVTYEDVLILRQFITSTGEMLPQSETGLCAREHYKVSMAVKMAMRANLLPGEEDQTHEHGRYVPKLNRYLTKFQIGSRDPIKDRGEWYEQKPYYVGDKKMISDAPRVSTEKVEYEQ